ncbi:MAG TPA: hypothetical protein DDX91_07885 [Ruminococcaceae bacterium]|nr:hypothetical protein [Oscillospiraceae bacterium]
MPSEALNLFGLPVFHFSAFCLEILEICQIILRFLFLLNIAPAIKDCRRVQEQIKKQKSTVICHIESIFDAEVFICVK